MTGLTSGTLVLQNNGDELNLSADGNYVFATGLQQGQVYNVNILTQPVDHYTCAVSNGSGTMAAQNISTIDITCTPLGYFHNGTANIKADDDVTALNIDDLQGLIHGNRFMLMSIATDLLYDGTFTSFSGDDYTADVIIYKAGAFLTTATATGTLTGGSKMTGDLAGVGAGNGPFELTYAQSNDALATLARIETEFTNSSPRAGEFWGASLFGLGRNGGFAVTAERGFFGVITGNFDLFNSCAYSLGSSLNPIAASSLYSAEIIFKGCNGVTATNSDGTYTGLATLVSVDSLDDGILLAFTKDDTNEVNGSSQLGFFAVYRKLDFP